MTIQIRNLSFSYNDRPILKDINLTIFPERLTVLLGKNGSGKSTLFKIIAGLLKYNNGRINVMDHPAESMSRVQRARLIGFLPQQHHPVFPFLVKDVVLTGRASHIALMPKDEDRQAALIAMERIGIGHLSDRAFTDLSGGEQQLVMIARVLAQNPKIILFDEPTSHLDFVNSNRLLKLARELVQSGFTVVMVLHDPNQAFLYGDDFVFLKNGSIFHPENNLRPWSREVLEAVYQTLVKTIPYEDRALVVPSK